MGECVSKDSDFCYWCGERLLGYHEEKIHSKCMPLYQAYLDKVKKELKEEEIKRKESIDKIEEITTENKESEKLVIKPWGKYETIYVGSGFKVKILTINPGQRISLQRHCWRLEHWLIVEGCGHLTLDSDRGILHTGNSVDIPIGAWHRMENKQQTPLIIAEVQMGKCFEEDIERKEDDYGRV